MPLDLWRSCIKYYWSNYLVKIKQLRDFDLLIWKRERDDLIGYILGTPQLMRPSSVCINAFLMGGHQSATHKNGDSGGGWGPEALSESPRCNDMVADLHFRRFFGTAIKCEIARRFPRSVVKVGLHVQCKNISILSGVQP